MGRNMRQGAAAECGTNLVDTDFDASWGRPLQRYWNFPVLYLVASEGGEGPNL